MKKTETFPLYHLEEKTPASIQFELMKMPDFFFENGEARAI